MGIYMFKAKKMCLHKDEKGREESLYIKINVPIVKYSEESVRDANELGWGHDFSQKIVDDLIADGHEWTFPSIAYLKPDHTKYCRKCLINYLNMQSPLQVIFFNQPYCELIGLDPKYLKNWQEKALELDLAPSTVADELELMLDLVSKNDKIIAEVGNYNKV